MINPDKMLLNASGYSELDYSTKLVAYRAVRAEINEPNESDKQNDKLAEMSSTSSTSFLRADLAPKSELGLNSIKAKQSLNNTIYLRDYIAKSELSLKLSDENLRSLKEHFGEQDFKDKEGGVQLLGKAQSYVFGWFADIAYQRGYLQADFDGDGELSLDEQKRTKSYFSDFGYYEYDEMAKVVRSMVTTGAQNYLSFSDFKENDALIALFKDFSYTYSNIETALNQTLKQDKNFDGIVAMGELFSADEMAKKRKDMVLYDLYQSGVRDWTPRVFEAFADIHKFKSKNEQKDDESSKLILAMLKAMTLGFEQLSSDEKELVSRELPKLKDESKKLDLARLETSVKKEILQSASLDERL